MASSALTIVPVTASEISMGIAEYLMRSGERFRDGKWSCPGYSTEHRLQDGRLAQMWLSDIDQSGDPRSMPRSELRTIVTAASLSQFGFESLERGLSGQWAEYALLLGPPTGNGVTDYRYEHRNFIPMGANVSDLVNRASQRRYQADMAALLTELSRRE